MWNDVYSVTVDITTLKEIIKKQSISVIPTAFSVPLVVRVTSI